MIDSCVRMEKFGMNINNNVNETYISDWPMIKHIAVSVRYDLL